MTSAKRRSTLEGFAAHNTGIQRGCVVQQPDARLRALAPAVEAVLAAGHVDIEEIATALNRRVGTLLFGVLRLYAFWGHAPSLAAIPVRPWAGEEWIKFTAYADAVALGRQIHVVPAQGYVTFEALMSSRVSTTAAGTERPIAAAQRCISYWGVSGHRGRTIIYHPEARDRLRTKAAGAHYAFADDALECSTALIQRLQINERAPVMPGSVQLLQKVDFTMAWNAWVTSQFSRNCRWRE